jgi:succinate-semialdehyde dehydrogenase/glutarate-semialdehyde dehydrogenase
MSPRLRPLKDPSLLRTAAHIGGRWVEATGSTYTIANPATGQPLAELSRCGSSETRAAVDAAAAAFESWRATTAKQRSEVLRRWYELIMSNRDDLAIILTSEEGKPVAEARGEIDYAASFVQWFGEEAKRVYGDVIPAPRERTRILVLKEPVGVCAAITPWNFPAAMITRKVAPALAAGCTVVLKPAEQTPLTALALAVLAERAGVPSGVLNLVIGGREDAALIGAELTGDERVRKVTFTGSTAVGRRLLAQSAASVKKVSMELGGNAPFIVFDDTDIDAAVQGLLVAKFRNTGQSCVGANRVLVQDGVHDEFAERFTERMCALKVGDGFDPDSQIGPVISAAAIEKLERHIADAVAKGAQVMAGGARHALGGQFFEPTVLTGCTDAMELSSEESFGPLVPLFRFSTEAEAVALANDTEYGLATYLFSRSSERIWRIASQLETGMLGINCGLISFEVAPFGGVKQSGLGREGSRYGIDEFLEIKYLCWQTE